MNTLLAILDSLAFPQARGALVLLLALLLNAMLVTDTFLSRAHRLPGNIANRLIDRLEARYNRPGMTEAMQRQDGFSFLLFLVFFFAGLGCILAAAALYSPWGWAIEAFLAASLLSLRHLSDSLRGLEDGAARSLAETRAAFTGLTGDLPPEGETEVITGEGLSAARDDFATGTMGAIIWYLVGGLPLLVTYKAIAGAARLTPNTPFGTASGKAFAAAARLPRIIGEALLVATRPITPVVRMIGEPMAGIHQLRRQLLITVSLVALALIGLAALRLHLPLLYPSLP